MKHLHWLEISRSALVHNLSQYKNTVSPATRVMVMVKANAYGHGLEETCRILKNRADFFAVNTISEAMVIRKLNPKARILIAAPIYPSDFKKAQNNHISLCVHSLEYLSRLKKYHLHIHLKINTGTNRLGLSLVDLLNALSLLRHHKNLIPEGIYTHFHSSDEGSPQSLIQLDIFNQAVFQTKFYFPRILAHCSSSSSALLWPQTHLDMIRIGISLYGLWPDPYVKKHSSPKKLKPVLSWKCHPVQIRNIRTGESVGYSAAYICKKPGMMAVLPIGYSDGYDRKLSNNGRVWSAGKYCPVIGRVAMNFTMINIPKPVTKPHNIIELIGPHVTADEIAAKTGTINYEVVSRLNPQIPRIIVK